MRHVLALATIFFLGCGDGTSPVQPTAPTLEFSLSGGVVDTAFRPLADARVEVVDGPRAGAFTTTDQSGQYEMPGVFSDVTALSASKEGHLLTTQTVQRSAGSGKQYLWFTLETTAPSQDITGEYILTLTADTTCTTLPDVARTRTYDAAVALNPRSTTPHVYQAVLSGAKFYPSTLNDRFSIGVADSFARLLIDFDYGIGIAEEVAPETYVSIWGSADVSLNGSSFSGPLDAWFEYCASHVAGPGFYRCPVPPVTCQSPNHRVTLKRR